MACKKPSSNRAASDVFCRPMARYIFITGGVVSSLGKGLASAALGALLQARGYSVRLRKLDPYLNVDPGTMSPYQHGEVFVTDDGAETDLDLGHYERFTGVPAKQVRQHHHRAASTRTILAKERRGDYLGGTVQVIPHVTDAIKEFVLSRQRRASTSCWWRSAARSATSRACRSSRPSASSATSCRAAHAVLHPPDAAAVHPDGRRAEDQADAALGEGAALDRHPARHPAVPLRPADPGDRARARSRCSATCARRR